MRGFVVYKAARPLILLLKFNKKSVSIVHKSENITNWK